MARRKSPGTSKITRGTTAPKQAKRTEIESPETAEDLSGVVAQPPREITMEEVRRRAYEKFVARGFAHGNALGDWLAAEAELRDTSR
jgi:hypothetical protein